jgi:hypothetical protein
VKEHQLNAETLCNGVLTRHIQEGFDEIRNRVIENGSDCGDGTITIVIKVGIHASGEGARTTVLEPKIKKPALKSVGQIVRFNSGVAVVDRDEDSEGNQRLPFTVTKGGK